MGGGGEKRRENKSSRVMFLYILGEDMDTQGRVKDT